MDDFRGPPSVIVVDDHPVVRAGLRSLLEQGDAFRVVADAADAGEALAAWQLLRPDLVLTDIGLPGMDGIALVSELCRRDPSARVAVMTALGGDHDVHRAVHAGALGYVLKDCGRAELVACLQQVARGRRYLQGVVAERLAAAVHAERPTMREIDVLRGLARGMSNKRIAAHLRIGEGTIKTHVRSLLLKLEARTRTEAVRLAVQRGFIHLAPDDRMA